MIKLHSVGAPKTAPLEFYTITAAETVTIGEALVLSSGKLTKCGATATPEFISVGAGTAVALVSSLIAYASDAGCGIYTGTGTSTRTTCT